MNNPTVTQLVANVAACRERLAASERRRTLVLSELDADVQRRKDAVCVAATALASAEAPWSVSPEAPLSDNGELMYARFMREKCS